MRGLHDKFLPSAKTCTRFLRISSDFCEFPVISANFGLIFLPLIIRGINTLDPPNMHSYESNVSFVLKRHAHEHALLHINLKFSSKNAII